MKIKKEIEQLLSEPILGHPSREYETRINRLEQAVLLLAESAEFLWANKNYN